MTEIIPIDKIIIAPERQRQHFPEQEMEELRASIYSNKGLMCPILVRPTDEGTYILVAGERRLRTISAEQQALYGFGNQSIKPGFIPAVVKDFSSDLEAEEAELHENIVRLDLTWQEKARAIAKLHAFQKKLNPDQTTSQTAALIDDSPTHEKTGYANASVVKSVQASVLVADFLDDEEVRKAASLKDATKVVTRKLEQDAMARMREFSEKKAAEAAEAAAARPVDTEAPSVESITNVLKEPNPLAALFHTTTKMELLEGDMRERIKDVPDASINVVVTDPPYGIGVADFGDSGVSALKHEYSEEGFEDLYDTLVSNLDRICGPTAHVYLFYDPYVIVDEEFENVDGQKVAVDIMFHQKLCSMFSKEWRIRPKPLIWSKGHTGNLIDGTGHGYKHSYEHILFASRGKRPCSEIISDVIQIPMVRDKQHAAQKPVDLYARLLTMSAVPGDTILDAFAGSGTIFRAAQGRMYKRVIGIEQDATYLDICKLAMENKQVDWEPDY